MQFSSIKQQVMLFGGASLLAVTIAMLGYSYYNGDMLMQELDELVLHDAEAGLKEQLSLSAQVEAGKINLVFNEAMDIATTYSEAFNGTDPKISRQSVIQLLENTITNTPNIIGIYSGWEVNGFDGQSSLYKGTEFAQSNGEFSPYFNRSPSGEVHVEATYPFYSTGLTSTGIRESEWYLCPMETKRSCVIDPASYEIQGVSTLMSSFVSPVVRDGKFVGMFGVDYSLDFLQSLATSASQNLISGHSRVIILSPLGIVGADSAEPANIGKMLSGTSLKTLIADRTLGETVTAGSNLIAAESFRTIGTDTEWEVIVVAPQNIALASAQAIVDTVVAHFSSNLSGQMVVGFISALLGLVMMWFVSVSIASPISVLVARVKALTHSGGDLTQQIDIDRKDETGQLANHLNTFISDVRGIVTDVAGSVGSLKQSVAATAEAATQSQTQIMSQSQEIEQVVAATNEMSSTAHSVSDNAQETAEAVSLTQQSVAQGQDVVGANAEGLHELANNVVDATQVIEELEVQTNSIGSILEVIRNISEQTNLLALNAAIEAARAGEQGRGFAVVADEVRNLATKTADSTDEIQQMIDGLRTSSKQAVDTMQVNRRLSDKCMSHAEEAVKALEAVSVQSGKIQDMAHQIASAAEEQAAVTEEVNRSIVAINEAAESIGKGAQMSQEESNRVASYTNDVSDKINFFRY
ncbi:methyl-accepting chemotaxis protein [Photobacterium alginatilyticum]|uniref:Methyl-accepting chemotaxis protein n=1 Tax=Photobacterium alginatilyticum TaxID=1775171 RepID=A0ABW9YRL0_9GAMM|nr:methyl-accepting chemotaxis protein [Photobacterium alginatilyticum]NBI56126.1 methyl-accepting chemotaxis protein [Photobacterium alginatilyticum]